MKIFLDGFVCKSLGDGTSLEISGVGQELVLVREVPGQRSTGESSSSAPVKSRAIMGGANGSVRCSLTLLGVTGEDVSER